MRFLLALCLLAAPASLLLAPPAHAEEPAALTPYQKLVGQTFVADMAGKPVTVQVVYDGVTDSNIVTLYKNSKIKTKDRIFINHHDPAGQAAAPAVPGASVMPSFAISFDKAMGDQILALKPGTVVTVSGTAEKTVFGMMAVKTEGLHVNADRLEVVPQ